MPAHDITTSYYLEPAVMTAPGAFDPLLADLPPGIVAVAEAAHGLLIHEHIAGSYGVTLTQEDRASVHIRPVAGLLERITAQDRRPLTVARTPASRVAGNCRHFTVLAVAALRAQGTPAPRRGGGGGSRGRGSAPLSRGAARRAPAGAGYARPGPVRFRRLLRLGLVRRSLGVRVLEPGRAALGAGRPALVGRLPPATHDPGAAFAELTAAYATDDRLRVPATVYNAVLNRSEPVLDQDHAPRPPV